MGFIAYMFYVELMKLWEMKIGCLRKIRRKERYQLLLVEALFLFCIFAESLNLIRAFIRVFQLVGESEASPTF